MLLVVVMLVAVLTGVVFKTQLAPVAGKGKGVNPGEADAAVESASTQGTAAPGNALDRARGLEDALKRQQDDLDKRIDSAQTGAAK
jgi:hypothetical protein